MASAVECNTLDDPRRHHIVLNEPGPMTTQTRPHTASADTRHTAAYRMAQDPKMPLTDVQWVLGHAFLSTTQRYLNPVTEDVIAGVLAFHARQLLRDPVPTPAAGYRPESLQILFGGNQP
jgi:hypothetical protein